MPTCFQAVTALSCLLLCIPAARAESYPSKPIRIVVTAAAGGANDVLVRAIGQRLLETWGKAVIVENRPGANGDVAADLVAKSAHDGYTLLSAAEATFVVKPFLPGALRTHPANDFVAVSGLGVVNQVLVVHPSLPVRNMRELLALAKSNSAALTYAANGPASATHLNMELLQSMAGIRLTAVQYRGGGPALADVIGGHVQMTLLSMALVAPPWKAGQVRALGIGTSKRLKEFPELPTIAESGLPDFEAGSWFGLWAPKGTAQEIVVKLNTEVQRVLFDARFRDQFLAPNFFEPMIGTPDQFAGYIRSESTKWSKLIKEANIKAD